MTMKEAEAAEAEAEEEAEEEEEEAAAEAAGYARRGSARRRVRDCATRNSRCGQC